MRSRPPSDPAAYRTIVVDPPWPYPEGFVTQENHEIAGRRRRADERGPVVRRALPYQAMSMSSLAALPIRKLADTNCRLFLWVTNRHLPSALHLLADWGFIYKQLLVWDKTPNFPRLGGSVAPNACEYLVVGIRGNPERIGFGSSSILRARKPRTTHSTKPDAFLDLIEQVSPGPYLELFARRQRLGWDTWGNEALQHVEVA